MKKTFLFTSILLLSQALFAQFESFDLTKYKLPDIKRKQLDLKIDLSESSNHFKYTPEPMDGEEYSDFNFSNSTNIGYNSFTNTRRLQSRQNYSLLCSPGMTSGKTNGVKNKSNRLYTRIVINSTNRIYFRDQYFFEPDVNFTGNYLSEKNDQALVDVNREEYNVSLGIPLMVGKGRIEPVQDARLAVYIFQELQKTGRISRIPSDEEILEFATLISQLKNERYFDYRLRRMVEIEKADSFLQAKGIINKADARYFTTVYDNWEYASGPEREAGTRLSFGFNPRISYTHNFRKAQYEDPLAVSKDDLRISHYQVQLIADYLNTRPVNLYWQRTAGASAYFLYEAFRLNNRVSQNEYVNNNKSVTVGGYYKLGYYPNSRTNVTGAGSLFATYNKTEYINESSVDEYSVDENTFEIFPQLSLSANYYFSAQLRLQFNFAARYQYDSRNIRSIYETDYWHNKFNTFDQELTLGFIYSIF